MGLSSISPWSLILILLIVVLLFGTKKLRGMGKDLGQAFRSFKSEIDKDETDDKDQSK